MSDVPWSSGPMNAKQVFRSYALALLSLLGVNLLASALFAGNSLGGLTAVRAGLLGLIPAGWGLLVLYLVNSWGGAYLIGAALAALAILGDLAGHSLAGKPWWLSGSPLWNTGHTLLYAAGMTCCIASLQYHRRRWRVPRSR